MSEKEFKRRKIAKAVLCKAWRTFKSCMLSWRTCLRICWRTVRFMLPIRHSKARGTTFGNRQDVLRRLNRYSPSDIGLYFEREPNNEFDTNAIKIVAVVRNHGSAIVGYVSKDLASGLAPMLDEGHEAAIFLNGITGSDVGGFKFGLNFDFVIL